MALASVQDDKHSGSTRLHCDLCDAFNVMVYASGHAGTALWHIFRASDSHKIRKYLLTTQKSVDGVDPIHGQQNYLGPKQLLQLQESYGVVPFIIHQGVGEAIYIPAGCPHQVCLHAETSQILAE